MNNEKKGNEHHQHSDMGNRGATCPQMHHDENEGGMMTHEMRAKMLNQHHQQTLWVYWTIIILGIWLILSPLTFGYNMGVVEPSGGRSVWLSLESRIAVLKWSDIISGALLLVFGWRSLTPNRPISIWICCFIGVWLNIAPLLFWSPTAVGYYNDTLVGTLIIALTILIPGMPNMIMYMKMGSEVPTGWTYNPSSWPQRWIMMVTGFLGWIVSRYLAAYQLGYIDQMWDPFFGEASEKVLNSSMSHSLPISDAGLGALAYTFEFLMGWMGSPSRWRTMPWMVALFGLLVIPLGLVHIFLVISQPLVVGYWCTFCLAAAAIMLPMIPLEVDEVIAMGQHMVKATRKDEGFWKVFWKGGTPEEKNNDERSPALMELPQKPAAVIKASIWGMSAPWTLVVTSVLGLLLMFTPAIFNLPTKNTLADIDHLCGALVIVTSVICMGEVVRAGRFFNVLLGLAVAVLPWFIGDSNTGFAIVNSIAGVAIGLLSIPRGKVKERYGLWDKYVV